MSFYLYLLVTRGVGRGTGPWLPPHLSTAAALCDCSAPLNRECVYRENVVGGHLRAPSNDEKSLRKVPPMTTVRRPPWVKCPPLAIAPPPSRFSKYAAACHWYWWIQKGILERWGGYTHTQKKFLQIPKTHQISISYITKLSFLEIFPKI